MATAPIRKRMRIAGMDYRYPGPYFAAACTAGRLCLFGEVRGGVMHVDPAGRMVLDEWFRLPSWNPWVILDEVVVMPNHVHGVIGIGTEDAPPPVPRPTLGAVIGRFKARSAAVINRARGTPGAAVWQRGYFERIVRSDRALDAIRDYILSNPGMWERDPENLFRRSSTAMTGGLRPPLRGTPPARRSDV